MGKQSDETAPKRELILAAGRALFAEKGYETVTIADIARKAGIAVGTVYLYFRNKHEVYTAIALEVEASIAMAFQNPELLRLPFRQMLAAMIDEVFRTGREQMELITLLQIDMHSSEEVKQHKESHDRVAQILTVILQQAVERGELAPFNTEMYAQILSVMGDGVVHQCFALERGEREELFRRSFTEFLQRLFFGPSLQEGQQQETQS